MKKSTRGRHSILWHSGLGGGQSASNHESSLLAVSVWNPNLYRCFREREIDSSQCLTYNSPFILHSTLIAGDQKESHVLYISTTVKPQEEARAWISKAYEHKKRSKSPGPAAG